MLFVLSEVFLKRAETVGEQGLSVLLEFEDVARNISSSS